MDDEHYYNYEDIKNFPTFQLVLKELRWKVEGVWKLYIKRNKEKGEKLCKKRTFSIAFIVDGINESIKNWKRW
jgi:hypothetical protein